MSINNKINRTNLYHNFPKKGTSNIGIIKCCYMVFTKNGLEKNIGSYILLFIILIFIVDMIIFWFFGYKSFLTKISLIFKRKNNIKKNMNTINNMNNLETNRNVRTIKKKGNKKIKNKLNFKINLNIEKIKEIKN